MIAYKGFLPGLICRDYQFKMGLNVTEKANCAQNGFHCAENPLDCLFYYGDVRQSEYYIVDAGGDIDEDNVDSKIACTELKILRKLEINQLILHGLAYMADHPKLPWRSQVRRNCATACGGYAVVRGTDPIARGKMGDILAFAKESPEGDEIEKIAISRVDGKKILPDTWYSVDWEVRLGR
uniref:DUF7666 domain-containing protein n=1 Tax=Enterocloster aldenensis TaxID=358742 RepID=UPI0022DEB7EE